MTPAPIPPGDDGAAAADTMRLDWLLAGIALVTTRSIGEAAPVRDHYLLTGARGRHDIDLLMREDAKLSAARSLRSPSTETPDK